MRAWLGRIAAHILVVTMMAVSAATAQAQTAADIDILNEQVVQRYGQGKYAEATAIALQALTFAERLLGKEHPSTFDSVNNLAALYQI